MAGDAPITEAEMIAALATQTAALLAAIATQTAELVTAELTAAHLLMVETAEVNAHHVLFPDPLIVPLIAKNRNEDYFESIESS